jgi:hypothetical protein
VGANTVVRKVPGGKLFRLRFWPRQGKVSLDGDFFVHPEEGMELLERSLQECARMQDAQVAVRYLEEKIDEGSIVIIGAEAADLVAALWEAKG